ncbi:hypothetical protein QYE76_069905 [Lolium multiflorum]|uniref:Uncharacterized protein n=1 Tax=Lolium multiflorum TaxID=4521 RepID=A0AAD8WDZ0_LOLMU|nr:hypothetical protein QYE76_069905 [Lolium multiflorum]
MSVSTGKSPAVPAAGGGGNGVAAAGGSLSYRPGFVPAPEETMTKEARVMREAEKAELQKKIASAKDEIVALEAALAEMDAAAVSDPTKP